MLNSNWAVAGSSVDDDATDAKPVSLGKNCWRIQRIASFGRVLKG